MLAMLVVGCGHDGKCHGPPATSAQAAAGAWIPVNLSIRTEPVPCESVDLANCQGQRHHLYLETDFDGTWWSVEVDLNDADYLEASGVDTDTLPGRVTLEGDGAVQVAIDGTGILILASPTVFGCQ